MDPFGQDTSMVKSTSLSASQRTHVFRRNVRKRLGSVRDQLHDPILTVLTVLLLFLLFVVVPLHASGIIPAQGYGLLLVLVLASCVIVQSRTLMVVMVLLAALALSFTASVLRINMASNHHLYFEAGACLTIGLLLIWVVARAVFAPGRVTYHRINGAILLYLTIGLTFVALFTFADLLTQHAFSCLSAADDQPLASSLIYFSFVTLTSTGYGDIVPVHPIARSLSNLEGIIGQLYPATLLARLISLEIEDRRR